MNIPDRTTMPVTMVNSLLKRAEGRGFNKGYKEAGEIGLEALNSIKQQILLGFRATHRNADLRECIAEIGRVVANHKALPREVLDENLIELSEKLTQRATAYSHAWMKLVKAIPDSGDDVENLDILRGFVSDLQDSIDDVVHHNGNIEHLYNTTEMIPYVTNIRESIEEILEILDDKNKKRRNRERSEETVERANIFVNKLEQFPKLSLLKVAEKALEDLPKNLLCEAGTLVTCFYRIYGSRRKWEQSYDR